MRLLFARVRLQFGRWRRTQRIKLRFLRMLWSNPDYRKHVIPWIRSQQDGYLLNKPMPWLVFDAISFLQTRIPPQASVFEYGSGGSTLYWLSRGCTCVSVEHDEAWSQILSARLGSKKGIEYRYIPPEPGQLCPAADPADPNCYQSSLAPFLDFNFKRYVTAIDTYPEACFDIVSIDGRARASCVMHGAKHVKVGGLLILDNSDREHYTAQTSQYLVDFQAHHFAGPAPVTPYLAQTSIYIRLR